MMQFKTGTITKLNGVGSLSDRQIRVVASTPTPDRVGDIMEPSGCDLRAYRENPIVLADHDASKPIGTAFVSILPSRVEALITFAPAGVSAKADEYCGLAKSGILKTVSIGFNPVEAKPTPGSGGGLRYTKWEMMELSIVAVPCNPEALVIERSFGSKAGRVLSHANESAIRRASSHLDKAAGHLRDVLNQTGDDEDDNEGDGTDRELSARAEREKTLSRHRLAEVAHLRRIGEAHELALSPDDRACERRMREIEALEMAYPFDADRARRIREAEVFALSICP